MHIFLSKHADETGSRAVSPFPKVLSGDRTGHANDKLMFVSLTNKFENSNNLL